MKTKTIEDNWPERTIQIPTGEKIRLIADDPEDVSEVVAKNPANREIGEIRFSCEEYNPQGDILLLITHLDLNKLGPNYTRQGIGEAILRMVKDHNDLPLVARCHLSGIQMGDDSHLTGIGRDFAFEMRIRGLIERSCNDPWCPCQPERYTGCEEECPEDHGLEN